MQIEFLVMIRGESLLVSSNDVADSVGQKYFWNPLNVFYPVCVCVCGGGGGGGAPPRTFKLLAVTSPLTKNSR
jgi:hypothetical protein